MPERLSDAPADEDGLVPGTVLVAIATGRRFTVQAADEEFVMVRGSHETVTVERAALLDEVATGLVKIYP
jgi:hypothetical protein